ncbi:MAG: ParA family protein [Solirubrobacterales bacterium]|nr:ParA family protein [Solirubrobacterales bacterium]
MGRIYAIANQKGGVGKTTTAVNLAAAVAEAGYSTLLVDIDPQANATVGVGLEKDLSPSIYDVLSGAAPTLAAIRSSRINNLSVIPATPALAGAGVELPQQADFQHVLKEALDSIRDRFEFIILDCPPSLGPLTVNALAAADEVIVPVQSEYYALEGLAGLLETLELVKRQLNPNLTVCGLVLTMHDPRTRLSRDVERELRTHFPRLVFDTVIPRNVRIGESPSHGLPVIHHDPHCAGAEAYVALAREVAARA